jgi:hypothetical protein
MNLQGLLLIQNEAEEIQSQHVRKRLRHSYGKEQTLRAHAHSFL